jgi:hypothetical protein
MEVIIDQDTGRVYIKREATPPGIAAQHTHQFDKFGITLVWDGHGNLLGVEFASEHHEPAIVRTISSDEPTQPGLLTSA